MLRSPSKPIEVVMYERRDERQLERPDDRPEYTGDRSEIEFEILGNTKLELVLLMQHLHTILLHQKPDVPVGEKGDPHRGERRLGGFVTSNSQMGHCYPRVLLNLWGLTQSRTPSTKCPKYP